MSDQEREEMGSTLDYFSLLGISPDAGQDEIEARYRELVNHLASPAIPATLRDWAARETALLDEAYAVLSDPDRREALSRPHPAAPAPTTAPLTAAPDDADASAEQLSRATADGPAQRQPVSAAQALLVGVPWKLIAIGAAIGIIVLSVVFIRLGSGGGDDGSPAANAGQPTFPPIDQAKVAELMTTIQQDPKNADSLYQLGEIYFLGGEWQTGIDWYNKLLEVEPNNTQARTDIGTAQFNLGNFGEAKNAWLETLKINPNVVEVHYNLGFLYANVDPVDIPAALNEWKTVVQLAPGSDLATTAQVHLDILAVQPSSTPAPSATQAPAGS